MKRTNIGFSAVLACLTLSAQQTQRPAGGDPAERFNQLNRNVDGKLSTEQVAQSPNENTF